MIKFITILVLIVVLLFLAPMLSGNQGLLHIEIASYVIETSVAAGIVMLLCLCAALMPESTRAEDGLELESVPDAYTVYLEGQTRVALGSISMTEASCKTLNLRKSPEWTLERVSGTSLTVHAEGTSRTLDDGTVIYGCNLILYSVSQTGDTVYDLTCKAGKRTVTQRFTVHSVHCGTGIPTNIAFARTSYQADVNERITVEPAILCTPSTAELPEEAGGRAW